MRKIAKASINDLKILQRAIRRQEGILEEEGLLDVGESLISDLDLSTAIEDGEVYICKENNAVLSFAIITYLVEEDVLIGSGLSLPELYGRFAYKEESLLGIKLLGIDPLCKDEKPAKDLFSSLFSKFSSYSVVTALNIKETNKINFLKSMGFIEVYKQEKVVLVHPLNDDGLCRNILW